jgi:plastocyanin
MKKNETVLSISVLLVLVIVSCVIAGCMTSQPGQGTAATTTGAAQQTTPVLSTSVAPTEKPVTGSVITIKNNDFQPAYIEINPGTTITVTNQDTVSHLLASDTGAPESFRTDKIPPGGSYTFTLTKSGYYTFQCILTPGRAGTIIIN